MKIYNFQIVRLGKRLFKVAEADRNHTKVNILDILEKSDSIVQRQLIETIISIAKIESVSKWPQLIEKINKRMMVYGLGNIFLAIVHGITRPYRYKLNHDEIQFLANSWAESLTIFFEAFTSKVDLEVSETVTTLTHCIDIFCSLNTQELLDIFEHKLESWMIGFIKILSVDQQSYQRQSAS